MKIAKYLILELLFILLVINSNGLFLDMDKGNQTCFVGVFNDYLKFDWSNYFHWFREDLNQACRFEGRILIGYMWFVLSYYTILKVYGSICCPVSEKFWFVISELMVYIVAFLYKMFQSQGLLITIASLGNAFVGSVLVFAPLIVYAILIMTIRLFLANHQEKIKPYWRNAHIALVCFFGSLFVFPPFTTLFYQTILSPIAFAYIYFGLPYILKQYLMGKSEVSENPFKTAIKTIGSILLSGLLLVFELPLSLVPLSEPAYFLRNFLFYLMITALLRGIIYVLIFWVWEPQKTKDFVCHIFQRN